MSCFQANNLITLLYKHCDLNKDKIIYTDLSNEGLPIEQLTFKGLITRINAIAFEVERLTNVGDRVLVATPTGIKFAEALLACLAAGRIAVPIYPPTKTKIDILRFINVADASSASAVLSDSSVSLDLGEDKGSQFWQKTKIINTDKIPTGSNKLYSPQSSEIALIQYTSGSTSIPKGVIITHENLIANLEGIKNHFRHNTDSCGVSWLPPYHDMGLVGGVLQPLYVGFPVYFIKPQSFLRRPILWLKVISTFKATTSGGPNSAYQILVDRTTDVDRKDLSLSYWQIAFNGAERVDVNTIEKFTEAFRPYGFKKESFFPCYGLAESTLYVTGGHYNSVLNKNCGSLAVSCGEYLPDHHVIVVDPVTKNVCNGDQEGEIWISGPSVARGYWNDPIRNKERFCSTFNGKRYVLTGDLGKLSAGKLTVTGRLSDLVIIRGRNYHPEDLETFVRTFNSSHFSIKLAIFSTNYSDGEQLVVVREVPIDIPEEKQMEIISSIREALGQGAGVKPDRIVLVRKGQIPVTKNGKIQRLECRQRLLDNQLRIIYEDSVNSHPASPLFLITPTEDLSRALQDSLTTFVACELKIPQNHVDPSAPLSVIGIDSLAQAQLISKVEQHAKITFDFDLLDIESLSIKRIASIAGATIKLRKILNDLSDEEKQIVLDQCSLSANSNDIPPSSSRISLEYCEEVNTINKTMKRLSESGMQYPYLTIQDGKSGRTTTINNEPMLQFSSNDYLNLSKHPSVIEAAKLSLDRYGASVSASRLVAGERPVHRDLEYELAAFIGVPDCLAFVSANLTNQTVIGHILDKRDAIFIDEVSHDSAVKGARLSKAGVIPFSHNNWHQLDQLLHAHRSSYQRALIFIEGLHSMEGDIPDLPYFLEIKEKHKAILMVDECLSIGTLGKTGRGITEHFDVDPSRVDLLMGGFSKAFGSCGGYIASSNKIINYLRLTTPGFIFTTGMTPSNAAAALAAIQVLDQEPERVQRLLRNSNMFRQLASQVGLNVGKSELGPLVPIIVGDTQICLKWYHELFRFGINAQPIIHPAVKHQYARIRFFLTAEHTQQDIEKTISILADLHTQTIHLV